MVNPVQYSQYSVVYSVLHQWLQVKSTWLVTKILLLLLSYKSSSTRSSNMNSSVATAMEAQAKALRIGGLVEHVNDAERGTVHMVRNVLIAAAMTDITANVNPSRLNGTGGLYEQLLSRYRTAVGVWCSLNKDCLVNEFLLFTKKNKLSNYNGKMLYSIWNASISGIRYLHTNWYLPALSTTWNGQPKPPSGDEDDRAGTSFTHFSLLTLLFSLSALSFFL